jgi:hypothetical protein
VHGDSVDVDDKLLVFVLDDGTVDRRRLPVFGPSSLSLVSLSTRSERNISRRPCESSPDHAIRVPVIFFKVRISERVLAWYVGQRCDCIRHQQEEARMRPRRTRQSPEGVAARVGSGAKNC